jgi:hypothetical protein
VNNNTEQQKKILLSQGITNVLGVRKLTTLKGDISLKNTIPIREKNESIYDNESEKLISSISHLLLNTGVFEISIRYNSSTFKSVSVFSPCSPEEHFGKNLLSHNFISSQYPLIPYEIKEKGIFEMNNYIMNSKLMEYITNKAWKEIMKDRQCFSLPNHDLLINTIRNLIKMREIEGYYLRSFCINIVHKSINLSFNCDGSLIISLDEFDNVFNSIV